MENIFLLHKGYFSCCFLAHMHLSGDEEKHTAHRGKKRGSFTSCLALLTRLLLSQHTSSAAALTYHATVYIACELYLFHGE